MKGKVVSWNWQKREGIIRTKKGREYPFSTSNWHLGIGPGECMKGEEDRF